MKHHGDPVERQGYDPDPGESRPEPRQDALKPANGQDVAAWVFRIATVNHDGLYIHMQNPA